MGYQYRGNIRDVEDDPTPTQPNRAEFDPAKCGTYAGYKQHQNHGVYPCQSCKDATAAYQRELKVRREAGLVVRGFKDDKCGTRAGYNRHIRYQVPLCDGCREARRAWRAQYYIEKSA